MSKDKRPLTVLSLIEELGRVNLESGDLPVRFWDGRDEEYVDVVSVDTHIHNYGSFIDLSKF